MLAAASLGSTAEALAALLPCPGVYAYVGALLVQGERSPNPIYQDWVDFYAPSREGLTPRIAAIQARFDEVAVNADAATLARCERNYVISSRYEWEFWDAAYHRRAWPV
jgi:thiaminase/transcriptional activator TenA